MSGQARRDRITSRLWTGGGGDKGYGDVNRPRHDAHAWLAVGTVVCFTCGPHAGELATIAPRTSVPPYVGDPPQTVYEVLLNEQASGVNARHVCTVASHLSVVEKEG